MYPITLTFLTPRHLTTRDSQGLPAEEKGAHERPSAEDLAARGQKPRAAIAAQGWQGGRVSGANRPIEEDRRDGGQPVEVG